MDIPDDPSELFAGETYVGNSNRASMHKVEDALIVALRAIIEADREAMKARVSGDVVIDLLEVIRTCRRALESVLDDKKLYDK